MKRVYKMPGKQKGRDKKLQDPTFMESRAAVVRVMSAHPGELVGAQQVVNEIKPRKGREKPFTTRAGARKHLLLLAAESVPIVKKAGRKWMLISPSDRALIVSDPHYEVELAETFTPEEWNHPWQRPLYRFQPIIEPKSGFKQYKVSINKRDEWRDYSKRPMSYLQVEKLKEKLKLKPLKSPK